MRVLQLIDSLHAGGAERMAVNLANALSTPIETSYLCVTREEGLLKASMDSSVQYVYLNKKSALDVQAILKLYKYVKSKDIDIIHAHSSSFFLGSLVKLLFPKVKLIWHDHYGNSELLHQRPYRVLRFCSRFFIAVFCVNTKLIEWNMKHLRVNRVQFLSNFAVPTTKAHGITQLKGTQGNRILCLANLRPQKDHLTLLKAFQKAHILHPDWTLHLVGKDFEDDYSDTINCLIKENQLEACVFLYGSRSDTEHIISQSDIGVLSSVSEGLPLALIEYGFGRLAVVVTDVGDCKRVITDDTVGRLVPSNDADSLSRAILEYINHPELRISVSNQLLALVKEQFSKDNILESLIFEYRQALSH